MWRAWNEKARVWCAHHICGNSIAPDIFDIHAFATRHSDDKIVFAADLFFKFLDALTFITAYTSYDVVNLHLGSLGGGAFLNIPNDLKQKFAMQSDIYINKMLEENWTET